MMPSEIKTLNLGLNQWKENEYPKRIDFVNDNVIIDGAVGKLSGLETEDKSDLVAAVNEVRGQIKNLAAYGVASGTNTYTAIIAGITALIEGFTVRVKFTNANTGASTLSINNLGAKAIVKCNGTALSSGNIKAGQIYNLAYNGSNFQLLGEGGEYGTATASDVLSGKTIGTEEGLVTGTMPNRGAVNQNLTTEGQEYTIPYGYHNGLGKIKAVITGLVASVIKAGTTAGGILGTFTLDATATAAQMLAGASAYVNGNKVTGTIPSKTAQTYTPGTANQTIAAGQYLSEVQTIAGSANLLEENIKENVNIFGKIGTLKPTTNIPSVTNTGITRVIAYNNTTYTTRKTQSQSRDVSKTYTLNMTGTIKLHLMLRGQSAMADRAAVAEIYKNNVKQTQVRVLSETSKDEDVVLSVNSGDEIKIELYSENSNFYVYLELISFEGLTSIPNLIGEATRIF